MTKNGFKVMDSDMHVNETWDVWLNNIDPEYRDLAPVGITKEQLVMNMAIQGKPIAGFLANADIQTHEEEANRRKVEAKHGNKYLKLAIDRGFDPVSQLHAMDTEGLDLAIIFPTRGMSVAGVPYEDGKYAGAVARAYNDWISEFCSQDPAKMRPAAMILAADIDEAVTEVCRTREEMNFLSAYLHPNPIRGRNWHNPIYDPLWQQCQDLDMPITFHETFKCSLPQGIADRFYNEPDKIWTMGHVACHPIEQMYACLCFCAGGILDRYSDLRVAFLECNTGWLPFWLWRMDEHYEHRIDQASRYQSILPSECFKRQCYLAIDPDEGPSKYAVDWIGDDNFVFSTDYPHADGKYPFAIDEFLKLPLSEESKKKVLWDNCAKLYGVAN